MKKINNRGFSLPELIIVIAIMAVLTGALAPALIKYVTKSKRSSDVSNCGTIQSAMQTAASNEEANAGFVSLTRNKWTALPSSPAAGETDTEDYWAVVDNDISGGLTAFQNTKTNKLADKTSFASTGYAYCIDSAGVIHVGITDGSDVYECVPTLDEQMDGNAGTGGVQALGGPIR